MAPRHGQRIVTHATSLAVGGVGVLIRGPSGSGKSDLALRLIDGGARLVADDQTLILRDGTALVIRLPEGAPAELVGRLEVRGIGILPVPHLKAARLGLVVDLSRADRLERLPAPAACSYLGIALPLIALDPAAASAPAKVRLAVRARAGFIMPAP